MNKNSILPHISKPGRYLGNEFNAAQPVWHKKDVHFALLFPDLYEIGMSHFGLQILYHIINRKDNMIAERCYCPDVDAEEIMRKKEIPLVSLESSTPLADFDILGITLPYELCYSNILTALDLSNIPFYSKDRDESYPIILGGGSCALNPEPVADFFDAILLGDGEEAVVEIGLTVSKAKKEGLSRKKTLNLLSEIKGVYVPRFFTPVYDDAGKITEIITEQDNSVTRRVVKDLDATSHLFSPIVPNAKIVHDRLGVEIARGCTRGCRFCQAGIIYRPVRERTVEQIMALAEKGIENSGFEELALLSLSTGDYSCIDNLLPELMDEFSHNYVSVSMPSMRVGTLSQPVMEQIKRVRKTGFTVAPEAGSQRLREVINKGITEPDLLKTCTDAFSLGWSAIKLYFMIGLPTETKEDILAIGDLAEKTRKTSIAGTHKRKQITVSVGTFVPKPHTPFQWEEQISLEESRSKIRFLKSNAPHKSIKIKYHDPETSFLEGVFSRGDRTLSKLIEEAWKNGARFDGWSDHFNLNIWRNSAEELEISLEKYLRKREQDEVLPWHHLSSGVDTTFLQEELQKAHDCNYTPDCRYHGCQKCGLCDFKTIQPVVHTKKRVEAEQKVPEVSEPSHQSETKHFKYMVHYTRKGDICYLGHLEILQLLFRTLRRAGVKPNYSKGFNPSPKVSFGGALPVGMESEAEFFILDMGSPISNTENVKQKLNECLPQGLRIKGLNLHSGKIPQNVINNYKIALVEAINDLQRDAIENFLKCTTFPVKRERKGKIKEIDIRPLVESLRVLNKNTLEMTVKSYTGKAGIKVQEALGHILLLPHAQLLESTITKISWQELTISGK